MTKHMDIVVILVARQPVEHLLSSASGVNNG